MNQFAFQIICVQPDASCGWRFTNPLTIFRAKNFCASGIVWPIYFPVCTRTDLKMQTAVGRAWCNASLPRRGGELNPLNCQKKNYIRAMPNGAAFTTGCTNTSRMK